ncbi:hypothetical protein GCM10012275_20670 [Longimycelium tulufanense]|uniref:Pyridoxamine 5'-phosphate oxidase family protein n=1 Tax=Longimycelium tulufanense TaxID=907463 RepID=A0A8J3FTV0_9PSEU|nr:pyridoxamine 5'-phosphate oxidase family protein [Longimycelium tulufanense]GGM49633.1 hypothetical protein GCM10012275_20670 [Longimycelium tulufanense]
MNAVPLSPTDRSTIKRHRDRAVTDRAALYDVLDAGPVCHLAFVTDDGSPVVLPTCYGRDGDTLYVHGSSGAHSLGLAGAGSEICVAVTALDGIVYGRSVFHHSVNYRSAVIHGVGRAVADEEGKLRGLRALAEHVAPGSWDYARRPNRKELAAVSVVALDLTEAAVKVRTGPPRDGTEASSSPDVWAGVVPVRPVAGEPEPCPHVPMGVPVPEHILRRVGGTTASRQH